MCLGLATPLRQWQKYYNHHHENFRNVQNSFSSLNPDPNLGLGRWMANDSDARCAFEELLAIGLTLRGPRKILLHV